MSEMSKSANLSAEQAKSTSINKLILAWIGAFATVILVSFSLDETIRNYVQENQNQNTNSLARLVSHYSELHFLLICLIPAAIYCHRRRQRLASKLILGMVLGSLIAGSVTLSIRCSTGRTRPSAQIPQGWYGLRHDGKWLVGVYDYNAFPSGHTGAAAGFVAVLLFQRRRGWWYLVLTVPALVGWSRIYLDRHRISDVVCGTMIGLGGGWVAARLIGLYKPETRNDQLAQSTTDPN
ncbi:MAG: phosphatase PAP2 family protein [Verrucomicrobia bacterium]|nr:MAG: phosphatase PAP2 family protein [Verrucomicrobiota bacterium]